MAALGVQIEETVPEVPQQKAPSLGRRRFATELLQEQTKEILAALGRFGQPRQNLVLAGTASRSLWLRVVFPEPMGPATTINPRPALKQPLKCSRTRV